MILIWSAPIWSCSRTAVRTLSTPSTTRVLAMRWQPQDDTGCSRSLRGRKSPWPPVGLSGEPLTKRRGPTTAPSMPSSTACFSAWSAPPASRTLVKPRRSMPRRIGSERSTTVAWASCEMSPRLMCENVTCTWQSISPGITVRPPASITSASRAAMGRLDTSRTIPSSTSSS